MQLKALELQGFKSFPERTVLRFDAGITAVVGPNGSGKSNLSDALRWVMGEQSTRALRGGKMEDVIFGGTPTRKRLGFAEVSMTLDNEDGSLPIEGSELTVTRRYFRSGDSEYYINRRLCRLRDVHELFMDTGLGQEGYSLIGQGKIDEILSVKSTQRREIFEEAAGISRYRHRKEEAERKLLHTRENLIRISDKMEELSLQLDPLAKQAELAKRYRSLQESLRIREVSLWMQQLRTLRTQQQELQVSYVKMQDALLQAEDACTLLYAKVEDLQRGAQETEAKMESARQEKARLEEEGAQTKQRSSVLAVQIDTLRETLSRLHAEEQTQCQREAELLSQESLRRQEHSALCHTISSLQQRLSAQQDARALADQTVWEKTKALSQCQEQMEQLLSELQRQESTLAALDASAQEVVAQENRLRLSLADAENQQHSARKLDEALQQERMALSEQWNQERLLCEEAQRDEERQGLEEASLQETWVSLRLEENALSARVRLLSEMERLYEGYSKSVKTVMERVLAGQLSGVHGPLASLIEVSQPYALAVEVALGGALQHLVVSTQEHGKAVLSDLKRKDGGRVTCLPLDAMRASRLNTQDLAGLPGYLGLATEHVSYDPTYEPLIFHLLGKVVLVSDLDCGIAMARQFRHRFRIVTLDGQVLAPGGAMTGGSINPKGGILTRASELSVLREKQDALEHTRLATERSYERAKALHRDASAKLEQAEAAQTNTEQRILLLDGEIRSRDAQTRDQARQLAHLTEEIALLSKRRSQAQGEAAKRKEAMAAIEHAFQCASEARLTAVDALQQAQLARDTLQDALQETQTNLAVSQAQQRSLEQSLSELSSRLQSFSSETEARTQEMQGLEAELLRLLEESNAQESQWDALQSQRDIVLQSLEALAQEKLSLEASRSQAERDSRLRNETLLHTQKEAVLLEQQRTSAQQEEALLLSKLWDQYELSHEAARALDRPFDDWAEVARDIAALRGQLRALGSVNLAAIEEYARVRERYDYLSEQKRDVVESDRQLTAIIRELTDEMKTVFQREFLRIGQAFGDTFRELFGGGSAQLLLEDTQDILSCGIDIRVSPPGKHLRSLSLLSGGEKAFVAIALYFAILKIHPTPFCVLDEIEAALDDANVLRFARYLRGMAKNTQFIVITHRRGTMEEADLLYGVTMEQQGVSRILSLNLKEAEEKFSGSAIG